MDDALQLADYAIIGIWILCLLLFGLQMLIYKKENHRAFRNLAIVTIITTLFKFACIGGLLFARTLSVGLIIASVKLKQRRLMDNTPAV